MGLKSFSAALFAKWVMLGDGFFTPFLDWSDGIWSTLRSSGLLLLRFFAGETRLDGELLLSLVGLDWQ
jgi:hypothetical protein